MPKSKRERVIAEVVTQFNGLPNENQIWLKTIHKSLRREWHSLYVALKALAKEQKKYDKKET